MTAPTAPNPRRRTALLAAFTLALALCALAPKAGAQATPYAEFQNSTLTGTTNTINVTNLPIVASNGTITYYNLTIPFTVTSNANDPLTVGTLTTVLAPETQTDGFFAGTCTGPSNDPNYIITVSGPGVGPNGTTQWNLQVASGANGNTSPSTASWWVGPVKDSPLYATLQKYKFSANQESAYYFGTGGSGNGGDWGNNSLLGFSQAGNALTIISFTSNGTTSNVQQSEITYTCTPSQ